MLFMIILTFTKVLLEKVHLRKSKWLCDLSAREDTFIGKLYKLIIVHYSRLQFPVFSIVVDSD